MVDYDAIKTQVDEKLKGWGIAYAVRYVGETKREGWQCDAWRISFARVSNPARLPGTMTIETDYYTGLGHRRMPDAFYFNGNRVRAERVIRHAGMMPLLGIYNPNGKRDQAVLEKAIDAVSKPVKPKAANVLHGLLMDSDACDMSFNYWCSDHGCSPDSISALNTYQACCKIGEDMRRMFTADQRQTIADMLSEF
jgi:hypothetical protein